MYTNDSILVLNLFAHRGSREWEDRTHFNDKVAPFGYVTYALCDNKGLPQGEISPTWLNEFETRAVAEKLVRQNKVIIEQMYYDLHPEARPKDA